MRFVLHTRIFSPHELPLFEAMARRCAAAVYVAEAEEEQEGRGGWKCDLAPERKVVLGSLSGAERVATWKRLLTKDTLVLFGWRNSPWRETIVASEALAVYVGELWSHPYGILPGWVQGFRPKIRRDVRWYRQALLARDNFHCFAQGVHALRDYRGFGFPKAHLWGYFVKPGGREGPADGGEGERPGRLRVLWVGRMIAWKRAETAIRAAGRASVRLTMVGEGPERPRLMRLAKAVERTNGGCSVAFLPFREMDEIRRLMRAHDVLVLTSNAREGWGAVVSEALEEGMSVFGTDEAGASATLLPPERRFRCGDDRRLAELLASPLARERMAMPFLWTAEGAAERLCAFASAVRQASAPPTVAASFWEEHCTECGEPACYRTCRHYVRGRGGRCRRFAGGLEETILGEGVSVQFLPWGKMEAFFHGRMVTVARARALERLAMRLSGLRRLFPRWWRSVRWRVALTHAERDCPRIWRLAATAERDERLTLQVVGPDLKEIFCSRLDLPSGKPAFAEFPLPSAKDGCLFRIFPTDGTQTGRILFECNQLIGSDGRVTASQVPSVKCVAWDLDGTLWKGTLAEDGVEGLTPEAEAVRLVKFLDAHGIVNSIVSRNDPSEALSALKKFGLEEYFVFPQIGWGPKSEGLRNLAAEMNIALDAIAFVDDREEVRNEVRANAPEVKVVGGLEGLEGLGGLGGLGGLEGLGGLGSSRRMMYREEMARRASQRKEYGGDYAAFLADSGLAEELLPVEDETTVRRCLELVQRTNQLNLTSRRYGEGDFRKLLAGADCKAVHVWDKYGDYGVVGFVALRGTHLVECCFSCRVAEKGVERRVLKTLAAGRVLTADVVETPRNGKIREIVKDFL